MTTPGWTYAPVAISIAALGVALFASNRGPSPGEAASNPQPVASITACVDADARQELAQLRARLEAREKVPAPRPLEATAIATPTALPGPTGKPKPGDGIRRYTRFEGVDPRVTIVQKDDGIFDIKTRDPSLSGTIMSIIAVGDDGVGDQMMIRIP